MNSVEKPALLGPKDSPEGLLQWLVDATAYATYGRPDFEEQCRLELVAITLKGDRPDLEKCLLLGHLGVPQELAISGVESYNSTQVARDSDG